MRYRPHLALVDLVLLVATLITIAGVGARFVDTQLLAPARWTQTSRRLIADPVVRGAVARLIVRRALGAGGIDAALSRSLPGPLAGTARHALNGAAGAAADGVLSSSGGRRAWRDANRQAVSSLVRAVDHPRRGQTVSLQLTPLLVDLVSGIARDPVARVIPGISSLLSLTTPDGGRLIILTAAQVRGARVVVKTTRVLSWMLPLAALGLFSTALLLAPGRRRIALGRVGYALMIAGGAMLGVRALAGSPLADGAVHSASDRAAVRAATLIATEQLRVEAIGLLVAGTVVVVASWLARLIVR